MKVLELGGGRSEALAGCIGGHSKIEWGCPMLELADSETGTRQHRPLSAYSLASAPTISPS